MTDPHDRPDGTSEEGAAMHRLIEELYPICRSITGEGVRETLRRIGRIVPLEVHEVPSGTPVLDWTVPDEWTIREAWVKDPTGRRVIDLRDHTLHLVSYSVPVHARMSLDELQPHLHSLPEQPDWIPYRTSYYAPTWGFCLADRARQALVPGEYEVMIDATLAPGHLTYGELLIPGEIDDEILISSHVCHPSLADDNLSGVAVAVTLAEQLLRTPRRHSVRFLFAPGTIGAITWLARNREAAARIRHGLTLTCLGDGAPITYKRTFAGDHAIDRVVPQVLADRNVPSEVIDFFPYGYDERQYNAPGFRIPVGSLMRGRHGRFPEYHTSADDLAFVTPAQLQASLEVVRDAIAGLDADRRYRSLAPYGEPQLGRRGIYRAMGGARDHEAAQMAMLWMLACADGEHDLVSVARRSGMTLVQLDEAARTLLEHELLEPVDD